MDYSLLPTLNALLNGTSAVLILTGYYHIRKGRRDVHKRFMLSAVGVSLLFFISYGVYHYNVGSVRFAGEGALRTIYLSILASHAILAVVNVPMVIALLTFALRGSFDRHKKLARKTFPVWLYVSVTGVVIYMMLYHL